MIDSLIITQIILPSNESIPRVEYTDIEIKTWGIIFEELTKLYSKHACKEFNKNLSLLIKYCAYRKDNIPQLEDISQFLKSKYHLIYH